MIAQAAPRINLGNTAKSLHAGREPLQGKALRVVRSPAPPGRAVAYQLRQFAGRLLYEPGGGKRQKFRVCHCGRSVKGETVSIYRAPDGSRARFSGTVTCGSGWTCPICSYRVGETRRKELEAANVAHVQAGGFTQLITLTFPHDRRDDLVETLTKFDKARQSFRNSRTWQSILGKTGDASCKGTVASLEITHGAANGWHPHLHMLAFVGRPLTLDETDRLTTQWVKCLFKAGFGEQSKLSDMLAHSLDVRGGEDAAAYIVKYGREEQWGMSSELTATHAKEAKGDSLKPFGLLRAAMEGDDAAGRLFVDFANAFLGKRLLTWSPGLRKQFNLSEDIDDDQLPDDPSDATQFVGFLTWEQWGLVLSRDALYSLEQYAAAHCLDPTTGQADLNDYIAYLERLPARSRGWFIPRMVAPPL